MITGEKVTKEEVERAIIEQKTEEEEIAELNAPEPIQVKNNNNE